ncbi:hypothetical protein [Caulobacter sp. BK020]|uniref:hypothetical protein n=1 Tax=Caulobacter sp. BK020 TaxID=2512117 RepID=UPI001050F56E|nr:hypothetical protein [Caulobacter sp. BK020]TCS15446.1 hypothetical protein EV278_105185 [Caulobacter sp. BK020]
MTREEIEAKLEAVEARTETRFVELSGKIDRLGEILTGDHGVLAQMAGLRADTVTHMASLRADTFAQMAGLRADTFTQMDSLKADTFTRMDSLKAGVFAQMDSLRADNKTTRWIVVVTGITSVLAAAALVMSVQANLLSAFQAGQPQSSSSSPH